MSNTWIGIVVVRENNCNHISKREHKEVRMSFD